MSSCSLALVIISLSLLNLKFNMDQPGCLFENHLFTSLSHSKMFLMKKKKKISTEHVCIKTARFPFQRIRWQIIISQYLLSLWRKRCLFECVLCVCACACACVHVCALHADLYTLCFIEGRAAEGVGDECGPSHSVCAVKLHAVWYPGSSRLKSIDNISNWTTVSNLIWLTTKWERDWWRMISLLTLCESAWDHF